MKNALEPIAVIDTKNVRCYYETRFMILEKLRFLASEKYGVCHRERIEICVTSLVNKDRKTGSYSFSVRMSNNIPPTQGTSQRPFPGQVLASDQCSYCGLTGHWKKQCYRFNNDMRGRGQRSLGQSKFAAPTSSKDASLTQNATAYTQ